VGGRDLVVVILSNVLAVAPPGTDDVRGKTLGELRLAGAAKSVE
jgi:hypothetical protein